MSHVMRYQRAQAADHVVDSASSDAVAAQCFWYFAGAGRHRFPRRTNKRKGDRIEMASARATPRRCEDPDRSHNAAVGPNSVSEYRDAAGEVRRARGEIGHADAGKRKRVKGGHLLRQELRLFCHAASRETAAECDTPSEKSPLVRLVRYPELGREFCAGR